ncbi:phospholipid phosphatase-related protein type 5-like [Saccoglossus kowalevskii]|uniref:Lipid phosphate phosphatase-related protein type 5-like n=1 Tax=Saccoglossus kowalevskii TaxID=10224 RepID=A0ABM0MPL8_SACKO|nr:PREDICTED: lipid phosphate phosphatase-related protein type 5-like [Saccoglossus kowalevskii]
MSRKVQHVTTNNYLVPCFILLDCVLLAAFIVLWYFVEFTDLLNVTEQGFMCHDKNLMKPFIKDEDLHIPKLMVYIMSFLLPFFVIVFGESSLAVYQLKSKDSDKEEKIVKSCGCNIHPQIRRTLRFIGMFTFGGFLTWILNDVGQLMSGKLTPYFLTVCQPNYTVIDCTQFVTAKSACTGNTDEIYQARLSFPSLYSSLSMYSAMFIALYMQSLLKITGSRLLTPFLCIGAITLAYLCGLSEIQQYRHHAVDVIFGFLLGAIIALYLCIVVLNNFKPRQHEYCEESPEGISVVTLPRAKLFPQNGNSISSHYKPDPLVFPNPAYLEDGVYNPGFPYQR